MCVFLPTECFLNLVLRTFPLAILSDSGANERGDSSRVKTLGFPDHTIGRGVGRFIFQHEIDFSFQPFLVTNVFFMFIRTQVGLYVNSFLPKINECYVLSAHKLIIRRPAIFLFSNRSRCSNWRFIICIYYSKNT